MLKVTDSSNRTTKPDMNLDSLDLYSYQCINSSEIVILISMYFKETIPHFSNFQILKFNLDKDA